MSSFRRQRRRETRWGTSPTPRRRFVVVTSAMLACLLFAQCATSTGTRMETVVGVGPTVPAAPRDFKPIRIAVLKFTNSANLKQFDIIPDGDYGAHTVGRRSRSSSCFSSGDSGKSHGTPRAPAADRDNKSGWDKESPKKKDEKKKAKTTDTKTDRKTGKTTEKTKEKKDPANVRSGQVAREVLETELFKSGRFEVIPAFRLEAEIARLRAESPKDPLVPVRAARNLGIHYIFYGDLTNFELRQERSYWQVPLWALLLIAAALIKDDDIRNYAWYTILRFMASVPLSSSFWDKGVGWSNLDLNVDVGMALRVVDTGTGSVVFSRTKNITRTDKVRNINLLVWASNRRLKITRSNAGRQMRFAAKSLMVDLAGWTDRLPPIKDPLPTRKAPVPPRPPGAKAADPEPGGKGGPKPLPKKPEPGSSV